MGQEIADGRGDANYEIVDIADYKLPLLGETDASEQAGAWNAKLASLDGFVFIVQEYNHSISGALKNALDYARDAWNNKADRHRQLRLRGRKPGRRNICAAFWANCPWRTCACIRRCRCSPISRTARCSSPPIFI